MAGDWIKVEHVTPDKPEIYQLASVCGITPEDAFGRCLRIWIWADQQSLNGHALTVTFVTLDAISRRDGFATALCKVKWLIDNGDGTVTFPNFDRHNGKTAKTRATSSDRKKNQRERDKENVTEESRFERDISVTREEKRREEINTFVSSKLPTCPHQEILSLFADVLPELPQPRIWEGTREKNLASRWKWVMDDLKKKGKEQTKEAGLDFFRRMFGYIKESDFLMGRNASWSADLGWIVKGENFSKIIDGNYENKVAA